MPEPTRISRRHLLAAAAALPAGLAFARPAAAPLRRDDDELAALFAAGPDITVPARAFAISRPLVLRSGHRVTFPRGCSIRQLTPNTPILTASGADDIVLDFDRAELWGEGTWSPRWTGSGGHDDRAIAMIACSNVTIRGAVIRNCGHSGMSFTGGNGIRIIRPVIEGTHRHTTPLPYEANFQLGIYLIHHPTQGAVDDVTIEGPDISGVAQGIVSELLVGAPQPVRGITISDARIHDIPGQHAFYLQAGATRILRPVIERVALSGVKIQAGDANADIRGFVATGVMARDLGSQMFEIITAPPFRGRVLDVTIDGTATRVGRAIGIGRRVEGVRGRLTATTVRDTAVEINGEEVRDIDLTIDASDIAGDGVAIYARRARGIRVTPRIRGANASNGRKACGIRIESPSAEVTLVNPDVEDAAQRMHYGLFNAIAGSVVRIEGTARFVGGADTAVRGTGRIEGLPMTATLRGRNGALLNPAAIGRR